ncbi:MAG: hypothetical protein MJZ41_11335 [Bacteroidaceae bacterium]|nr:hypothetical protein [Bacteroidaceae bacterium]
MQTATFDAKKNNLIELVRAIDSENVLDKILDFVRQKMNDSVSVSKAKNYDMDYEEASMVLNETTIEALNEAKRRTVYENENLFSSSKEMFNALDAE